VEVCQGERKGPSAQVAAEDSQGDHLHGGERAHLVDAVLPVGRCIGLIAQASIVLGEEAPDVRVDGFVRRIPRHVDGDSLVLRFLDLDGEGQIV
jgi:hypothetical protein